MEHARCKTCDAEIIWARTERGKLMPLDAEPAERPSGVFRLEVREGKEPLIFSAFGDPVYISHFATCPYADQHRRRS